MKDLEAPDGAPKPARKARGAVVKKRKSPDDESTSSLDKKPKVEPPPPPAAAATEDEHRRALPAKGGSELDFRLHVGHLGSPLMTFESTVRALLKTLNHGADIQLAEQNISFCAECKGGGDLLCCDCCQFAFHVDCLEPLERGSYLHVPYRKYGMRRASPLPLEEEVLFLEEHEWYCPYCLSLPVQRHWKRGIPQWLRTFDGFDSAVVERDNFARRGGQLAAWCKEVGDFVNDAELLGARETFPPNILLALTGIRRAVQRLGPAFQLETSAEVERLEQDIAQECPIVNDEDAAEPVDVKEEAAKMKTTIMKSASQKQVEEAPVPPPAHLQLPLSDEAMSESDPAKARLRPRRTRPAKPIAPTDDYNAAEPREAARMNVGGSFQVPSVHKYFTEALSFGCDYSLIDRASVFARLPKDSSSFVPLDCIPAKTTCRLMYSVSQWEDRKRNIFDLAPEDPRRIDTTVPLNADELAMYIRQVLQMWPAWIQWPASQEYALKLLHHCQYDARAALKLLCTDGLQFRPICDPPVRPYMNKWRPRDKRGMISTIPYPPPSVALTFAGVGEGSP